MGHKLIQGLKEIAEHLGLHLQHTDSRRVLHSWIEREGLPVRMLAGRWYADGAELEQWWNERLAARSRSDGRVSSPGTVKVPSPAKIAAPGLAGGSAGRTSSPGIPRTPVRVEPSGEQRSDAGNVDGTTQGRLAIVGR